MKAFRYYPLPLAISLILVFAHHAKAQAQTDTVNLSIPAGIFTIVPCADGSTGEFLLVEGSIHILVHSTINDKVMVVKQQFQLQGMSGVGETTGDKYQASGGSHSTTKVPFGGGAETFTQVNYFRFIGEGTGSNYRSKLVTHVTVNANGEITVDGVHVSEDCR